MASAAFCVTPSYDDREQFDGYLVSGYKMRDGFDDRRIWSNPALWVAKLDLGFYPVWERTVDGSFDSCRCGNTVVWDARGFYERDGVVIGGGRPCEGGFFIVPYHYDAPPFLGWDFDEQGGFVMRLYGDGEPHWDVNSGDPGKEWIPADIYSVAPLRFGGYVFRHQPPHSHHQCKSRFAAFGARNELFLRG